MPAVSSLSIERPDRAKWSSEKEILCFLPTHHSVADICAWHNCRTLTPGFDIGSENGLNGPKELMRWFDRVQPAAGGICGVIPQPNDETRA